MLFHRRKLAWILPDASPQLGGQRSGIVVVVLVCIAALTKQRRSKAISGQMAYLLRKRNGGPIKYT
jgi:hypothetical protein